MEKYLSDKNKCGAENEKLQTKLHYFGQKPTDICSMTPYGANDKAGHYVQADDAKIYYEVYGEGSPVLMLHGGMVGSAYELGRLIDLLKVDHQVIVMSTRGHGRSEIGHKPVTYEQRAADALAVLTAVTNEPAMVIGFSDGAYAAYKLASMYPSHVKRLVAMGAGENLKQLRVVSPFNVEAMMKADPVFMKSQMVLMPEPKRLQEHWNQMPEFYNDRMIADKKLFGSIKCPVLLMAGERDGNAPLATVIAAYYMIPDAQLAIIANAGHQCFVDNFDAVWAGIKPFINEDTNL